MSRSLFASISVHVAVALLLGARSRVSGSPASEAISIATFERAPVLVPIETEPFPDEPEGGRTPLDRIGQRDRPARRSGLGRGHLSGDARGHAPPTDARVTLGEPDVEALPLGIPRAEVLRTLVRRASEVRRCTPAGLERFARVVVELTVAPDGTVSASRIASSTLSNPAAESCMAAAVRSWTFAPAPNGGSTRVAYPFVVGPFDAG